MDLRLRLGQAGRFMFLAMKTPKLYGSQAVENVVSIVNVQILIELLRSDPKREETR